MILNDIRDPVDSAGNVCGEGSGPGRFGLDVAIVEVRRAEVIVSAIEALYVGADAPIVLSEPNTDGIRINIIFWALEGTVRR